MEAIVVGSEGTEDNAVQLGTLGADDGGGGVGEGHCGGDEPCNSSLREGFGRVQRGGKYFKLYRTKLRHLFYCNTN